jgi:hypothetical protein
VLKPKLDRAMDYDLRLRHVANTSSSERPATRSASARALQANEAVIGDPLRRRQPRRCAGRLRRDDQQGQHAFTGTLPRELLPEIMKAATATDSAATDMSRIAAAGIQNFGMGAKAEPRAIAKDWFNVAATGAKLGGFEMKNQAQYLPEQMALAGQVGMSGKTDFANLVMLNQAVEKASGTPDKAAVNVKQLLTDLGSQHFRQRVHQTTGVNFTKFAVENRLKGEGMIDSAMDLIDRRCRSTPRTSSCSATRRHHRPGAQGRIESSMKMIEGSETSKFFHNQESVQAVAAYRANREFIRSGQKEALSGTDRDRREPRVPAGRREVADRQARPESTNAMQSSMDKLTPFIGGVSRSLRRPDPGVPGLHDRDHRGDRRARLPRNCSWRAGDAGRQVFPAAKAAACSDAAPAACLGAFHAVPDDRGRSACQLRCRRAAAGAGSAWARRSARSRWAAARRRSSPATWCEQRRRIHRLRRRHGLRGKHHRRPRARARRRENAERRVAQLHAPRAPTASPTRRRGLDERGRLSRRRLRRSAPAHARPASLADRLGKAASEMPLPQELKGEIVLRVTGAWPGVQAETKSPRRRALRADVGTEHARRGPCDMSWRETIRCRRRELPRRSVQDDRRRIETGRRTCVHEFPDRDEPYPRTWASARSNGASTATSSAMTTWTSATR